MRRECKMKTSTNEYFINGLLQKESKVLREIYQEYFPAILKHVKSNNGRIEDAEDIFQDSLVILYRQAKKGGIEFTGKFSTYLFAIARNQWYKRLRDVYKRETTMENPLDFQDLSWKETIVETERQQLVKAKFKELGEACQKVMQLYLEKKSMKDIAIEMGYKDAKYARKKKCLCQQNLIRLVQEDPRYKELK